MLRRGGDESTDESQPVSPPDSRSDGEMTVIGVGARLEGNLISAASLRIEGKIKGQVTAEGDVVVAPEAQIDADIRAKNITIAGNYKGNVTAAGRLELSSTASVQGNLSCQSLVVQEGAKFSGQSIMNGGPDLEEASETEAAEKKSRI